MQKGLRGYTLCLVESATSLVITQVTLVFNPGRQYLSSSAKISLLPETQFRMGELSGMEPSQQ